uniref:ATP-dependent DNA helicase RecG n=1 Tax=Meloidogyne hapla TaxID=6305 RepID=A0A1I8B3F2_MELHA
MAKSEVGGNNSGNSGLNNEKAEKIPLKLILVSGRTYEFKNFTAATTAGELINLIYHGRFIHGSVTLGALHLPAGTSTVYFK